jgi:hypothetical protein
VIAAQVLLGIDAKQLAEAGAELLGCEVSCAAPAEAQGPSSVASMCSCASMGSCASGTSSGRSTSSSIDVASSSSGSSGSCASMGSCASGTSSGRSTSSSIDVAGSSSGRRGGPASTGASSSAGHGAARGRALLRHAAALLAAALQRPAGPAAVVSRGGILPALLAAAQELREERPPDLPLFKVRSALVPAYLGP